MILWNDEDKRFLENLWKGYQSGKLTRRKGKIKIVAKNRGDLIFRVDSV